MIGNEVWNYLFPDLFSTLILSGAAVVDEIPATVGTAVAVSVTAPRIDGRQVQVATILGFQIIQLWPLPTLCIRGVGLGSSAKHFGGLLLENLLLRSNLYFAI